MPEVINIGTCKDDLAKIVYDVFEAMLGIEVSPAMEEWKPARDRLTGAVYLAGAWKGAVLLECDCQQACHFTSRLMSIPAPAAIDDDVRDAIGELANMIGGNLKSILPYGAALSMPSIVAGSDYALRICGGNAESERLSFSSPAGSFWVTLIQLPE